MAKYNITPKQTRDVTYVSALSTQTVENIYEQIMLKFVVEKKYRDPSYTTSKMAQELGVNTRYISAVVNLRFHDNFSQLINEFRIKEAMYMMKDKHYEDKTIEEIASACGFSNRQCFYAAFFRKNQITPREYKLLHTGEK